MTLRLLFLQGFDELVSSPSSHAMSRLNFLFLYDNRLSGQIPSEIGLLSDLITLHLYNNYNIQGTIPTSIGNLWVLKELLLSQNNLSGTIPVQALRQLETLNMLFLSHNPRLSGTLDAQKLLLTNWSQLQALDVLNGTAIRMELEMNLTNRTEAEQRLEEVQETSFWRYYYECGRRFPCPINYDHPS